MRAPAQRPPPSPTCPNELTGPSFRLLLRLQQLLSSSEGPLTNQSSEKKQTSFAQRILVQEAIRFPISRWFAAFLVVVDFQQSPGWWSQGIQKRHLKKKVLPGPFGAARFYPPRWINGQKASTRLFRNTTTTAPPPFRSRPGCASPSLWPSFAVALPSSLSSDSTCWGAQHLDPPPTPW